MQKKFFSICEILSCQLTQKGSFSLRYCYTIRRHNRAQLLRVVCVAQVLYVAASVQPIVWDILSRVLLEFHLLHSRQRKVRACIVSSAIFPGTTHTSVPPSPFPSSPSSSLHPLSPSLLPFLLFHSSPLSSLSLYDIPSLPQPSSNDTRGSSLIVRIQASIQ